jgi:hypothetical protein
MMMAGGGGGGRLCRADCSVATPAPPLQQDFVLFSAGHVLKHHLSGVRQRGVHPRVLQAPGQAVHAVVVILMAADAHVGRQLGLAASPALCGTRVEGGGGGVGMVTWFGPAASCATGVCKACVHSPPAAPPSSSAPSSSSGAEEMEERRHRLTRPSVLPDRTSWSCTVLNATLVTLQRVATATKECHRSGKAGAPLTPTHRLTSACARPAP